MTPTALVTGAARRVGRAIAIELASKGFDVGVHYRSSQQEAESTADACRKVGGRAWTVQGDLGNIDDVVQMATMMKKRSSRLDILVNNASLFHPQPFENITNEEWDRMLTVNLKAPFVLSRECMPALRAAKGLVVHMCDIGGERPMPGYAHYSVSKSALIGLVKAMAVELGADVRTVGISPGHVVWPEDWDEAFRAAMLERIPQNRVGSVDDVAKLVGFLYANGGYINGDVIALDGGLGSHY